LTEEVVEEEEQEKQEEEEQEKQEEEEEEQEEEGGGDEDLEGCRRRIPTSSMTSSVMSRFVLCKSLINSTGWRTPSPLASAAWKIDLISYSTSCAVAWFQTFVVGLGAGGEAS